MRLKIPPVAFLFFKYQWVFFFCFCFKYANISKVYIVESTDDLTLVNDLYFFYSLLVHVLIKGKRVRVIEYCLLNDPGCVPTSSLYIACFPLG